MAIICGLLTKSWRNFAMHYNSWNDKTNGVLDSFSKITVNDQYKRLLDSARKEAKKKELFNNMVKSDYNQFVDDLLKSNPLNKNRQVCFHREILDAIIKEGII